MFLVMNNIKFATILALVALFFVACSEDSGSTNNALPEDSVKTGTFIDERDGQVYKTVTIGSQTWMAENLNYDFKLHGESYNNYCYMDHCTIYGRYYTWEVALNVCPTGWHLPDTAEWKALYRTIGEDPYAMQAMGVVKWENATNASGFSALPAGGGSFGPGNNYDFKDVESSALFWSATKQVEKTPFVTGEYAYRWYVDSDFASVAGESVANGLSVRCLKD